MIITFPDGPTLTLAELKAQAESNARLPFPREVGLQLIAEIERLEAERDTARETNKRLNRRCQLAEKAANEKVSDGRARGGSLGRALANYAAVLFERDLGKARAEKKRLQVEVERLETYTTFLHEALEDLLETVATPPLMETDAHVAARELVQRLTAKKLTSEQLDELVEPLRRE